MSENEIQELIGRLRNFRSRGAAIKALAGAGEAAIEPLIQALGTESQEGIRWAILRCLGDLRARAAVIHIAPLIEEPAYRSVVQQALVKIVGEDLGSVPGPWIKWVNAATTSAGSSAGVNAEMHVTGLEDGRLLELALKDSGASAETEREGMVVVDVPLPKDRRQEVTVNLRLKDHEGSSIVIVYADCGPAAPEHYELVLKRNLKMPYGALAIRDTDSGPAFVMFNTLLRDALSPLELRKSILTVGERAAQMRRTLEA